MLESCFDDNYPHPDFERIPSIGPCRESPGLNFFSFFSEIFWEMQESHYLENDLFDSKTEKKCRWEKVSDSPRKSERRCDSDNLMIIGYLTMVSIRGVVSRKEGDNVRLYDLECYYVVIEVGGTSRLGPKWICLLTNVKLFATNIFPIIISNIYNLSTV